MKTHPLVPQKIIQPALLVLIALTHAAAFLAPITVLAEDPAQNYKCSLSYQNIQIAGEKDFYGQVMNVVVTPDGKPILGTIPNSYARSTNLDGDKIYYIGANTLHNDPEGGGVLVGAKEGDLRLEVSVANSFDDLSMSRTDASVTLIVPGISPNFSLDSGRRSLHAIGIYCER